MLAGVYLYVLSTLPVVALMSAFWSEPNEPVLAICISTQVYPGGFSRYQPTVQMGCGLLSVLIFLLTWHCYKKQIASYHPDLRNNDRVLERERKMTLAVGTFRCIQT